MTDNGNQNTLGTNLDLVKDITAKLKQLSIDSLSTVAVKDGDIVLLRFGDPATGWVPPLDLVLATADRFAEAFAAAGLQVQIVTHNYALAVDVIRAKRETGSHSPGIGEELARNTMRAMTHATLAEDIESRLRG